MVRRTMMFHGTEKLPGVSPGITSPFGVAGGAAAANVGINPTEIPIADCLARRRHQGCFIVEPTPAVPADSLAVRDPLLPSLPPPAPEVVENYRFPLPGTPGGRIQ